MLELTDGVRVTGQVLLDGKDIYAPGVDVGEVRKRTGLLSQRPFPLPMSIYDNVAYGRRVHSMQTGRTWTRRCSTTWSWPGCGTR